MWNLPILVNARVIEVMQFMYQFLYALMHTLESGINVGVVYYLLKKIETLMRYDRNALIDVSHF